MKPTIIGSETRSIDLYTRDGKQWYIDPWDGKEREFTHGDRIIMMGQIPENQIQDSEISESKAPDNTPRTIAASKPVPLPPMELIETDTTDVPKYEPLPTVAGRRIATSNAAFEQACLVHIAAIQASPLPDNALLNTLCEAVRLVREYSDAMQGKVESLPIEQAARNCAEKCAAFTPMGFHFKSNAEWIEVFTPLILAAMRGVVAIDNRLQWALSHARMGLTRGGSGPAVEFLRDIVTWLEKGEVFPDVSMSAPPSEPPETLASLRRERDEARKRLKIVREQYAAEMEDRRTAESTIARMRTALESIKASEERTDKDTVRLFYDCVSIAEEALDDAGPDLVAEKEGA